MATNFYIQITFTEAEPAKQEILLALLSNAGYHGFEQDEKQLKAFISEREFDKDLLHESVAGIHSAYIVTKVEDRNWNEEWEKDFQPIVVDDKVAIRASFHKPVPNIAFEIVITPKMSFGTGHHATTYMVIQQMLKLDLVNKTVLDFGTGTGVLAILAEMKGADSVLAIDNDEWSIANAKENIHFNLQKNIVVEQASAIPENKTFDLVIANINLNVISENIIAIANATKPGGEIILSGFLTADNEAINTLVINQKFNMIDISQRSGWLCVHARKA